ncbi:ABC transporter ATP-binding protein [Halosimplex litoreum]|uniref:Molybdate/tungstate import ATP-binding protein WtpC n=1 Tax=Halosimplex litoreum TaxID=1198301 RepID=A0A7T3FY76_9EURY|nr:ABC transporter ATP-binding protein [Halosimplex litoreum]QPV62959.1 ABC transporter ATP-binding protein [Halosimplex litoreum]
MIEQTVPSAADDRVRTRDEHDGEPVLDLDGVTREFGQETAVDELSLSVYEGELLTLLGPSGCGKTTTLRLLAGLDSPDGGTIRVDDEVVAGPDAFVAPDDRDVGLVFQSFALFPHLTVGENVAFGIDDWSADDREARVEELLDLVNLSDYREGSPDDLSGGQRQRVALARSLAPEPDVLLLDEPFSNLDVSLRVEMREEVRRIIKQTGVTAVSVTHDQEEALSISDRVAVISDGDVEQVGRPEVVFEQPESRFVAEFLGQAGFVSGTLDSGSVETDLGTLSADVIEGLGREYDGARVDVMVRPDDLVATPADGDSVEAEPGIDPGNGEIVHRQYTGPSFVYQVQLDGGDHVYCEHNHADDLALDQRVRVDLRVDHPLAWFPAE